MALSSDARLIHSSVIAVLLVVGSMTPEAMTQSERPIVFSRVCNIEPGQDAAAVALAREMVALVNERYPGAEMTARTGRWMTGFPIARSARQPDPLHPTAP